MKVTTDSCLFGAWVAARVQEFKVQSLKLLDVGTGSGLLPLMIAQKNDVEIDAIEIDEDAAQQAKENVNGSPWKEKITIINGDVLQWKPDKKYDCIISNPPFYEGELKSDKNAKNIAHHDEGLKLGELLHFIKLHLTDNGIFFLLLPAKREIGLNPFLKQNNLYLQKKLGVKQTPNHQPFRIMIQGLKKQSELIVHQLTIKNIEQAYTPEFVSLLKDYYLYL